MIYVLVLNDMRSSQIETECPVAWSPTRESLVRLLETEKVAGYNDGHWGKSFRAGGPLEWMNPPGLTGGIRSVNADVVNGVPTYPPVRIEALDGVMRID